LRSLRRGAIKVGYPLGGSWKKMVLPSFVPPVAPLVLLVLRKKLLLVRGVYVTPHQVKEGVLLPLRPARLADHFEFPAVPEESLGGQ